ncbi:MAG: UDP-N-acetylmuramoyl-tripeptide--D-alanyl-D-alanine ligase, partial [Lachnospiraceae bacterium]|nr:UDP-N-acetylmuramoyl-tripeptide--D-alanyl-D-alanine ligase [Lachnospiraceae bacterium]
MSKVRIVGIVGSVGKTSTKELVASVLEQRFNTLKTEGNFNNELGVPLTIFRLRDEHEAAVVEMGINHFGEMDRLGEIVKPDAVVFTNVGPCHLEFLRDLDGLLRAKSEVFKHVRAGGTLILNAEDEKLSTVRDVPGLSIVRYGRGGDIYAENTVNMGLKGTETDILYHTGPWMENVAGDTASEGRFSAKVHLPGAHMVLNSLAATAAGLMFGMDPAEISAGIAA